MEEVELAEVKSDIQDARAALKVVRGRDRDMELALHYELIELLKEKRRLSAGMENLLSLVFRNFELIQSFL